MLVRGQQFFDTNLECHKGNSYLNVLAIGVSGEDSGIFKVADLRKKYRFKFGDWLNLYGLAYSIESL